MSFPPFATEAEALQLLRVAMQGAAVATHDELRAWLAGPVGTLLPHEAVLLACGDFRSGDLRCELVCARALPPGRPGLQLAPLVNYLRDCWVAAQHAPCRVDVGTFLGALEPSLPALPPGGVGAMRSALVHGTRDGLRDPVRPCESIVAALGAPAARADAQVQAQAMRLLTPVIDAALRHTPARPARPRARAAAVANAGGGLSERERQIMGWVALGKTNPEIGCILRISEFTVKNHLKSIFAKLDVCNRAQAVARLTQVAVHA